MDAFSLRQRMLSLASAQQATLYKRYFKVAPGEYAETDVFCGVKTPQITALAKEGKSLALKEVELLLTDELHELRSCALKILAMQFEREDGAKKREIVQLYLRCLDWVNNWDLVDCSCYKILGAWLIDKDRSLLYELAQSKESIWRPRVAIVSTLFFIKQGDFRDTLELAKILLSHPHDLIHKAIGWMLREVGKREVSVLQDFLDSFSSQLPRTSLRYAIERLPEEERRAWLKKKL